MRIVRFGLGAVLLLLVTQQLVPAALSNLLARRTLALYSAERSGVMEASRTLGGPRPAEINDSSVIAHATHPLVQIPLFARMIPERALGEYYLANKQPDQAAVWLGRFTAQHPTDVIARLALGNAQYMLRRGTESSIEYNHVLDQFERICCEPRWEGSLRQQWMEIQRRVREAELLDAYGQMESVPDSAVRRLETAKSTWPHELTRLYLLSELYRKLGLADNLQKTEEALAYADFQAYGLREVFLAAIDDLTQRGIWSPEMKRRAELGFFWDEQSPRTESERDRLGQLAQDGCLSTSPGEAPPDDSLPPLSEWSSVVYASQAGLVADGSYRFKRICGPGNGCLATVLGLWQEPSVGDQQEARAGYMSPGTALPAGRYRFTLRYCTALGDRPDLPAVQVYIEGSPALPLDLRLPGTGGQWRESSSMIEISENDSRSALRFWVASYGNGLALFAQPNLAHDVQ